MNEPMHVAVEVVRGPIGSRPSSSRHPLIRQLRPSGLSDRPRWLHPASSVCPFHFVAFPRFFSPLKWNALQEYRWSEILLEALAVRVIIRNQGRSEKRASATPPSFLSAITPTRGCRVVGMKLATGLIPMSRQFDEFDSTSSF